MNRKELLFGTAYYPEYMPYDRIDEDFTMMKKAGMNVVRIAESTWSILEKEEGVFDFSYIDRTLKKAEETDMKVIIGTPTYAVPSWLVKKDPDIMVITKEGRAPYGHRQLFDLLNPTYRYYGERVIRKLLEHTARHPAVIGFQIDNETKHYGNEGEEMQRLFREYLKEKYKDTEAFNKAFYLAHWSNSIHSWEDLPDMRGCINGGLAGEFEAFKRSIAAGFLSWQAEIVKEFKSGTLSLGVDDIGVAAAEALTGAKIDANGVLISASENDGAPVAVGFRARKANGTYRYFWLYRVKFAVPSTNLTTKGDSIEFSTPTIEGTVTRRNKLDGKNEHPWKAEVNEDDTAVEASVISGWYTEVYEPDYTEDVA